jgi:MSHA biogenesis protein MshK
VFKFLQVTSFIFLCFINLAQAQVDPTRPLGGGDTIAGAAKGEQETITLMSIFIGEDRKMAIINGQSVHENEIVKGVGVKVLKIDADAVTLQQGNKIWHLPLNKVVIRK